MSRENSEPEQNHGPEPNYRFAKLPSGKKWHLLDKQGDPRCGAKPTSGWLFQEELNYPNSEELCRMCLEPRSAYKENQLRQVRDAARMGLEAMPTIPHGWRYEPLTHLQEMFLLRHGFLPKVMRGKNRAWAAEEIFRLKGNIWE